MNHYGAMQVTAILMFFTFVACSNEYDKQSRFIGKVYENPMQVRNDTNLNTVDENDAKPNSDENVTKPSVEENVTKSITEENVTISTTEEELPTTTTEESVTKPTTEENVTESTTEENVTNPTTEENSSNTNQTAADPNSHRNIVRANYEDHGLEGHLLAIDERTGLLIPPKPLSKAEIKTLIVDSEWKDKYCKVSVDYTIFRQVWYDHYCFEKVQLGEKSSKFRNVCCGGQVCHCRWTDENKPYNCDCVAPNLIE